ncbi:hypothetical protein CMI37_34275 [Candidatus Pacearchaeota archaeon]|nr:hypothetical protein [Candidatus Pacearchaeota archaeon]|tara:strand:+ start:2766 stop:3191 length:426 start_codon:yes stop_codon:yes gene_type:complete
MGHDITAFHGDDEVITHVRRSSRDPLNQVMYLALGVYDEAYASVSGKGCTIEFTSEELVGALEILDQKDFAGMEKPENIIDDLMQAINEFAQKHNGTVEEIYPTPQNSNSDSDVSPEKQFLHECLEYIEQSGDEAVSVHFW